MGRSVLHGLMTTMMTCEQRDISLLFAMLICISTNVLQCLTLTSTASG